MKHSALPWALRGGDSPRSSLTVSPDGDVVESFGDPRKGSYFDGPPLTTKEHLANARYIVRACNAHYELLEACKAALNMALRISRDADCEEVVMLKAAIAQATNPEE